MMRARWGKQEDAQLDEVDFERRDTAVHAPPELDSGPGSLARRSTCRLRSLGTRFLTCDSETGPGLFTEER